MSNPAGRKMGLIGFGAFGQFAARHLRDHFDIVASDSDDRSAEAGALGVSWGSTATAARCPYVLLAVPVQAIAGVAGAIAEHLTPGALVIDVASVKMETTAAMEGAFGPDIEILGTHPMFGPQSATDGVAGHRIVLCPVRTERLEPARRFLETQLGLDVHVCDAETHDREIAQTQALAQFVGRALAQLDNSNSPVRTPGYNLFREVAETVGNDSWELFRAIQNHNPYAADMRAVLLGHLEALQSRLDEAD